MLGGKSLLRKVLLLEWIGSCGISRKLSSQVDVLLTSDACTYGRALLACLCRELVEIPHQVESPALLAMQKRGYGMSTVLSLHSVKTALSLHFIEAVK